MKNYQTHIKISLLLVSLLLAGATNTFAQERFVSKEYKIAFKTPKNSVKDANSTASNVTFEESTESGVGGSLNFNVNTPKMPEVVSALASGDKDVEEAFITGFLDGLKEGFGNGKVTVVGKKRLEIAGFNSLNLQVDVVIYGKKVRGSAYFIPVSEHRRIYSFAIIALDAEFDKWSVNAENSVFSFEIIKDNSGVALLESKEIFPNPKG